MKVKDLIKRLQNIDPELDVYVNAHATVDGKSVVVREEVNFTGTTPSNRRFLLTNEISKSKLKEAIKTSLYK